MGLCLLFLESTKRELLSLQFDEIDLSSLGIVHLHLIIRYMHIPRQHSKHDILKQTSPAPSVARGPSSLPESLHLLLFVHVLTVAFFLI